jgi:alpha-L-rhamnosidase
MNILKRNVAGLSFLLSLLVLSSCLSAVKEAGSITALGLTCEYAVDPLGVDSAQPRFGWVLKSDARGQAQSAYQILVAGSEKKLKADVGDKWDSGKVASDQSVNVEYRGKPLTSGEKCYWKVRVWDHQGRPSTWSKRGRF